MRTRVTTIVIADDHRGMRETIRKLLESEPGFSVIGESGDGERAIELVHSLKPDVLVTDISMDGMNGIEVARHVKDQPPGTHVIVMSTHNGDAFIKAALRAGAEGYVVKGEDDLVSTVHQVILGHALPQPALNTYVFSERERRLG